MFSVMSFKEAGECYIAASNKLIILSKVTLEDANYQAYIK